MLIGVDSTIIMIRNSQTTIGNHYGGRHIGHRPVRDGCGCRISRFGTQRSCTLTQPDIRLPRAAQRTVGHHPVPHLYIYIYIYLFIYIFIYSFIYLLIHLFTYYLFMCVCVYVSSGFRGCRTAGTKLREYNTGLKTPLHHRN